MGTLEKLKAQMNNRRYYANHKDKVAEKNKRYYAAHHEECLERQRLYRQAHRQELRLYAREYSKAHAENTYEMHHTYYLKNKERILMRNKLIQSLGKERGKIAYKEWLGEQYNGNDRKECID